MEIVKHKICLEDGISRVKDSTYGSLTADTFYVKIMLYQNMDDMGVYDNSEDFTLLQPTVDQNLSDFPDNDIRYVNKTFPQYLKSGDIVSGSTDSKKEFFKKYDLNNRYEENFDIEKETYNDPFGNVIDGKSKITTITNTGTTYVIDSDENSVNISGIHYEDFNKLTRNIYFDGNSSTFNAIIPKTDFRFKSQGFNSENVSLAPIIKNEYLFGITETPKVENDIFIDRGNSSVFDKHMKLSGIFSVQQLEQFGNGEFNIVK